MTTLLERQLAASVKEVQESRMSTSIQKADEKPAPLAKVMPQETGMSVELLVERVEKVKEVHRRLMQKDVHFGIIPGVKKDCLYKPGAELLGMAFQLGPQFKTEERRDGDHLECVVTCTLFRQGDGAEMGSGLGSCSTKEKKYAWRGGERKCPECGKPAIIRGKEEYGGGWLCFKRKDGCGAKFKAGDSAIEGQPVGRTPNPDIADDYNTVRKMACKRAHVAAILFVTCASEIFTQDVEDMHEASYDDPGRFPDEERAAPPKASPRFDKSVETMAKVEAEIAKANPVTWQRVCEWRAIIGARQGWPKTELMRVNSELAQGDEIGPSQRKEIGKTWNRIDRQLTRLEGVVPKPGPEESMREPGDDSDEETPL